MRHSSLLSSLSSFARAATLLLLGSLGTPAWGALLPEATRTELLQAVQQQFWGKARYADGSPVLPADEAERQRLPVSPAVARQVMDVGELSGLAEWCDLDWQGHYLTLTTSARRHGFTEKQLAFIGVTHGALQGFMARAMQQRSCEDEQRERVAQLLRQSPNRSFP